MEKLDIFHITQVKDLCVLVFYKSSSKINGKTSNIICNMFNTNINIYVDG